MATRALTPDREKMTSLLKEMMRRSPDPHLPEERDRISGALSDRAFPFVVFLKKADEDQAARVTAVFTYWFEDAYDGLLENYPRSASPADQATKEAEVRDGHERVTTAQPSQPIQRSAAARRMTSHFGGRARRAPTEAVAKRIRAVRPWRLPAATLRPIAPTAANYFLCCML